MSIPAIQYSGKTGEKSIGYGSAETLTKDLQTLADMFNPLAKNPDGSQGGINSTNIQPNSISDTSIGQFTPNPDTTLDFNGTGILSLVLSMITKIIISITGNATWYEKSKIKATEIISKFAELDKIDETYGIDISLLKSDVTVLLSNVYTKVLIDYMLKNIIINGSNIANRSIEIRHLASNLVIDGDISLLALFQDLTKRVEDIENSVNVNVVIDGGTFFDSPDSYVDIRDGGIFE